MGDSFPPDVEAVMALARLFDTSRQAVIGTTLDGSIVYWNDAAAALYGWSAEEVLGRLAADVTPAPAAVASAAAIMEQLRHGRGWFGTFEVRRRDGSEFRVSVRDLPVRDRAGELVGIVGVSERIEQAE